MSNLGQMMTGGYRGGRNKDDFYSTPTECTEAFMKAEELDIPDLVWEPACGTGAMSEVLSREFHVVSTDLVNRGYGDSGVDFLMENELQARGIITNPPFKLAEKFIRKSHELGAEYVAMFLKATFWHAASRLKLFSDHRPARIYALTWRPDFSGAGNPTMDCIWVVWNGLAKTTEYHLLEKP